MMFGHTFLFCILFLMTAVACESVPEAVSAPDTVYALPADAPQGEPEPFKMMSPEMRKQFIKFKELYNRKKAQGYDLTEVDDLFGQAKKAFGRKDRNQAMKLFRKAYSTLESANTVIGKIREVDVPEIAREKISEMAERGFKKNVYSGISFFSARYPSDEQIDFVNKHFSFVITSRPAFFRDKIKGIPLYLYSNLLEKTESMRGFDWKHIDSNENMFTHCSQSRFKNKRIFGGFKGKFFLMDRSDLVDDSDPNALNHYVNYFAHVVVGKMEDDGCDGLYVDMAHNIVNTKSWKGHLPDGYTEEKWRRATQRALGHIKTKMKGKSLFCNCVELSHREDENLRFVDGGLCEVWPFRAEMDEYLGKDHWKHILDVVEAKKKDKIIGLVSRKVGLNNDRECRMFIVASYLLVGNENIALRMRDAGPDRPSVVSYHPEYDIDLGPPLESFSALDNAVYMRRFAKGLVLVNPAEDKSYICKLKKKYKKVVSQGSPFVNRDGSWTGSLAYEPVEDRVTLDPVRGIVLVQVE